MQRGTPLLRVANSRVNLSNLNFFARMYALYAKHFALPFATRTNIGVRAFPIGKNVETDMRVAT
jgi:hypothetical protein